MRDEEIRDEDDSADATGARAVLSEVHMNESALGEAERVSRYRYLVPQATKNLATRGIAEAPRGNLDSSGDEEEDAEESARDEHVVRRKRRRKRQPELLAQGRSRPTYEILTIVHRMATPLSLVGQQVWSAAFLLADFVLTHEERFAGAQVLELGAGAGVAGLVAARVARRCFLTDYHDEVLGLLQRNVNANMHLIGRQLSTTLPAGYDPCSGRDGIPPIAGKELPAVVAVRKLDWFNTPGSGHHEQGSTSFSNSFTGTAASAEGEMDKGDMNHRTAGGLTGGGCGHNTRKKIPVAPGDEDSPFEWQDGELQGLKECRTSHVGSKGLVVMASDIIYDTALTEAFFDALRGFMPPPQNDSQHGLDEAGVVLYLALEKRFNFTLEDLSVTATGYRAFVRNVLRKIPGSVAARGGQLPSDPAAERRDPVETQDFEGVRLPLDFTQCFVYHRNEAMELWEIRRRGGKA